MRKIIIDGVEASIDKEISGPFSEYSSHMRQKNLKTCLRFPYLDLNITIDSITPGQKWNYSVPISAFIIQELTPHLMHVFQKR